MTLPVWPDIPYSPDESVFKRSAPHLPVLSSTDCEDGPPLMRVQGNTAIAKFPYQLPPLTKTQKETFRTFVETTLKQGTCHFTMLVPLNTEDYVSKRCFIDGGAWSETQVGLVNYIITFTLGVFVNS